MYNVYAMLHSIQTDRQTMQTDRQTMDLGNSSSSVWF